MELFLVWIVLAIVVAIIAGSKGRNGFGWFIYGFLLWPVAMVHILVLPKTAVAEQESIRHRAEAEGRQPCPHCAEFILVQANVCPHCQRDLDPSWSGPATVPVIPDVIVLFELPTFWSFRRVDCFWFNGTQYPNRQEANLVREEYIAAVEAEYGEQNS